MKISSVDVGVKKFQPTFQKRGIEHVQKTQVPQLPQAEVKPQSKFKKAMPYVLAATVGVVGLGAGLLIGSKRPAKIGELFGKITKKPIPFDEKAMLALIALAGFGGFAKGEIEQKELEEKLDSIINNQSPNQRAIAHQGSDISEIKRTQTNVTVNKHAEYFHSILLLKQNNVLNRNAQKYAKAIEQIENIGMEKLTSDKKLPILDKQNPVIWSITSEFAPIKEGGLGSVPPEVRNNAEKLGVNMPTFIPMYLNEGSSTLLSNGEEYTYIYKGKEMPLKKMATIKMDAYKNGIPHSIPVSYYLYTDKDKEGRERQLIFMQADDYFDGTIYEANAKTEEPEKFAVMSKAVYEFAKLKMDGAKSSKNIAIYDSNSLSDVKEPDGMILNDWQASPTAALLRYKAVMENAHGQLSDSATSKLKDMRVITIGHNAMYQGSTQNDNNYYQKKAATSNILNTLFDKYAYDIVTHAKSGATTIDPKDEGLKALDNVLVMDYERGGENYTNFLNMGVILSDYFDPVSQNYANELISPEHKNLSYMLQWALTQKAKAGKLVGIINGNDFENLSIQAKLGQIKKLTGVDFKTYEKTDSIHDIQKARLKNKIHLYEDYVLPFSESNASSKDAIESARAISSRLEFVKGKQGTILPVMTDKELANTPILMSGGRLVSQKGMDVLCDAIKILFDNWDKDFYGETKPIFYIAGADGEGGVQRKIIEDLKDEKLSKEDNNRILFAHGFAPMAAMMAGADYFLMPSIFEPCGLTQGESLALGTPVIASAVGGIVDTINRDGKFNGVLTNKEKPLTAQEYYKAMKEGLRIFYDDKKQYSSMVKDSIDEDFSWSKNGKGPVHDYLHLLGIQK